MTLRDNFKVTLIFMACLIATGELILPIATGSQIESRIAISNKHSNDDQSSNLKESDEQARNSAELKKLDRQVFRCLQAIKSSGQFGGSGGRRGSCYHASHIVYKLMGPPTSSYAFDKYPKLDERMIEITLRAVNRAPEREDPELHKSEFPYHAVPLLGELAKQEQFQTILKIAADKGRSNTTRMLCFFAICRGGGEFYPEFFIELAKSEKDQERRIIAILTLTRVSDETTVIPLLLDLMESPNMEIAITAAYTIAKFQPKKALPKFKELLDRNSAVSKLQLLSALASYRTVDAQAILKDLLERELSKKGNESYIGRVLSAFVDCTGIKRPNWTHRDYDVRAAAYEALDEYASQLEAEKKLLNVLGTRVMNLQQKVSVTEKIYQLRHEEFRRILALRGDGIGDESDTRKAEDRLNVLESELKTLRSTLRPLHAKFKVLKSKHQ